MGILKEMFDEGSGDDLGNNREEVPKEYIKATPKPFCQAIKHIRKNML